MKYDNYDTVVESQFGGGYFDCEECDYQDDDDSESDFELFAVVLFGLFKLYKESLMRGYFFVLLLLGLAKYLLDVFL